MWGSSTMDVLLSKFEGYGDVPEFEVFKKGFTIKLEKVRLAIQAGK